MEWKLCLCISTSSKYDFKSLTLPVLQDQKLLICQNWYYLLYSQVPSLLTLEIRCLKGFLLLSLSMPGGALFQCRLAAPGSPRMELCVLANGIKQWLLHHLHVHSRDERDIRRTLNSTPGSSRSHTMHISWYNMGIPRMWTDFGKPFTWRHGSHVGVPNQSSGSWILFLCKRFLLFQ